MWHSNTLVIIKLFIKWKLIKENKPMQEFGGARVSIICPLLDENEKTIILKSNVYSTNLLLKVN